MSYSGYGFWKKRLKKTVRLAGAKTWKLRMRYAMPFREMTWSSWVAHYYSWVKPYFSDTDLDGYVFNEQVVAENLLVLEKLRGTLILSIMAKDGCVAAGLGLVNGNWGCQRNRPSSTDGKNSGTWLTLRHGITRSLIINLKWLLVEIKQLSHVVYQQANLEAHHWNKGCGISVGGALSWL